jgi:hypothetical protein
MSLRESDIAFGGIGTSFADILGAAHPGISASHAKKDQRIRQDLAVHLTLRDLFAPMGHDLASKVQALGATELSAVKDGFTHIAPFAQTYQHDWEAVRTARLMAQFGGEPVEGLRQRYEVLKIKYEEGEYGDDYEQNYLKQLEAYFEEALPRTAQKRDPQITHPASPEERTELASLLRSIEINTDPKKVDSPGELELGHFDSYFWLPTEVLTAEQTNITREILVPVGEYGEDFSRKLLLATKTLLKLADDLSLDKSIELAQSSREILKRVTARGRDERGFGEWEPEIIEVLPGPIDESSITERVVVDFTSDEITVEEDEFFVEVEDVENDELDPFDQVPLITLQEGIESITQSISLLMAEKVPGYEDPEALLEAIINKGMPNYLSLITPMGFVGPLNLKGEYVKNLVRVDSEGEVEFTPAIAKEILKQKKEGTKEYRANTVSVNRPEVMITGFGCPNGRGTDEYGDPVNQALSEALLHVFRSID